LQIFLFSILPCHHRLLSSRQFQGCLPTRRHNHPLDYLRGWMAVVPLLTPPVPRVAPRTLARLSIRLSPRVGNPFPPPLQTMRPRVHHIPLEINDVVPRVRNSLATRSRRTPSRDHNTPPTPLLFTHNNHPLCIPTPKGSTPPVFSSTPQQPNTNTTIPNTKATYPTPHLIPRNDAYRSSASGD